MSQDIIQVKYNTRNKPDTEDLNNWWMCDDDILYQSLWKKIDAIDSLYMRRRINTRNAILYENFYHQNAMVTGYPYNFGKVPNYDTRITYNVIRSVVDTVIARVTKNKPKVQFMTTGGNWSQQMRAKNLTRYVNASFKENNVYTEGIQAFKGACVKGQGCLKFIKNHERKRVEIENIPIDEIIVDDADGIYGKPKCLYHVRYVNKWVLKSLYPDFEQQIDSVDSPQLGGTQGQTELIEVAEAWRLPLKSDGSDGRHVICIKEATLYSEGYKSFDFPFSFSRWSMPMSGFYGTGLVDQLADIQMEIDRQLRFVSRALNLIAVPRIFVPSKSMLKDDVLTNEIGQVMRFDSGQGEAKPTFFTPQAVNAETYNFIKWLIESCYRLAGVSDISAKGEKPAGLNAAVAIRTVQDIEKARFFNVADSYQDMYIDAGEKLVTTSRELDQELRDKGDKEGLKVKSITDNEVEVLRWKDCDLDEDKYIMQAWPVSLLPDSPEGRLEMATELSEKGMIMPYQAAKLVDNPDLDSVVGLQVAAERLIDKILNKIKEKGIYTAPEPYFKLEYAIPAAQKMYNESKLENVPEERQMLILSFLEDCQRLIAMQAESAPSPEPAALPPEELPPEVVPEGLPPVEELPPEAI